MSGDFMNDPEGRPVPSVDERKVGGMKIGRVILIAAVIGIGLYAGLSFFTKKNKSEVTTDTTSSLPLVHADKGPTKVVPEQPGGMSIPNQDKLIYDKVAGVQSQVPEQLLPPPDKPMLRPGPATQIPGPETPATHTSGSQAPAAQTPVSQTPTKAEATPPITPGKVPTTAPVAKHLTTQAPKTLTPQDYTQTSEKPAPETAKVEKAKAEANKAKMAKAEKAKAEAHKAEMRKAEAVKSKKEAKPKLVKMAEAKLPKASRYMIQVAAMKDKESAKKLWLRLQKANGDLLGGFEPVLEPVTVKGGTLIRLRTGPFASKVIAADICVKLVQRKQACNVVR